MGGLRWTDESAPLPPPHQQPPPPHYQQPPLRRRLYGRRFCGGFRLQPIKSSPLKNAFSLSSIATSAPHDIWFWAYGMDLRTEFWTCGLDFRALVQRVAYALGRMAGSSRFSFLGRV
ncbi:hypothetical protein LIER_35273 [Lithospermum erythrorhizon]|uniref:Uncharacterized protein n=1 Tax=Lithospermum erythrorhizon TaxID=34254 RepID=A0AAV3NQC3_LITER